MKNMDMEDAFQLLADEREQQDKEWGHQTERDQSIPGYIMIMRRKIQQAEDAWLDGSIGRESALFRITQAAATGVAALQEHAVSTGKAATRWIRSARERFLDERKTYLRDTRGPYHNTPIEHAAYCVDIGRQLGKTEMLKAMLRDNVPCVLVVHSHDYGRGLINQLRREDELYTTNWSNIIVVTYDEIKDGWRNCERLRGIDRTLPVFVDNVVFDIITLDFVKFLNNKENRW